MQLRLPWTPAPSARPAVPRVVEAGGRVFLVQVARHRRARRYVLRVLSSGVLKLTVPRGASIAAGLAFAAGERAWIAAEWTRLAARDDWREGTPVWHAGCRQPLVRDGADLCVGDWRMTAAAETGWRRIIEARWREDAAASLPARCAALAAVHGLRPTSVRVRNQRSRWGACSGRGAITLNWRLVQMPAAVADYVILHELAHLRQPNHSRRFWREVESLCPDWRASERWLKTFGRELL